MKELLLHALVDAFLDSLKLLPFLLLVYFFIEYVEHKAGEKLMRSLSRFGRLGPLVGAAAGVVPQCGFSVTAANLYAGRLVSFGTLLAVLITTSDEALPILLSSPEGRKAAVPMLLVKLAVAIVLGFFADRAVCAAKASPEDAHDAVHAHCHHDCCSHGILPSVLRHTAMGMAFVFLSIVLVNLLVGFIGEANIAALFTGSAVMETLMAALLGFIPGCAMSIMLSELYISGAVSFASLTAGLVTNTGLGFLVLLRRSKNRRVPLLVGGLLFAAAAAVGLVLNLF